MPVNPRVQLVSTAGWEERAGAVAARVRVACLVRVTFADGYETEVEATAQAWSKRAVQVFFPHPTVSGPAYRVWVPVDRVRRLPAPQDPRQSTA